MKMQNCSIILKEPDLEFDSDWIFSGPVSNKYKDSSDDKSFEGTAESQNVFVRGLIKGRRQE